MKKANLIFVIAIILFSCKKDVEKFQILKNTSQKNFAKIGKQYAVETQQTLGKNLIQAISQNGTVGAISFCNIEAIPLTDSLQQKHNAVIKRVTDKNRNPVNKANFKELKHIETYKKALASGKTIEPIIEVTKDKVYFYSPIITNQMCMQCHGKPNSQIQYNTLIKLRKLYPNDKAVGYDINEIRGIWSIQFNK